MSKLNEALAALHEIDCESARRRRQTKIHPLSILFVTVMYITFTASFDKYDISRLLSMVLYLIVVCILNDLSVTKGFKRLKYILILLLFMGIVNPIFDRTVIGDVGNIQITSGMVSMLTLFIKGAFMVYAAYFMVIRIGIDGICYDFKTLHFPGIFITLITLTYRYIIVFIREIERMWTAYHMRAPGQKGININAWGSFIGLLMFRSIDRAENVYNSMQLRGYDENVGIPLEKVDYSFVLSVIYVLFLGMVFFILRNVPIFYLMGNIIRSIMHKISR